MPNVTRPVTWNVNERGCFICTSHKPNGDGYPYISTVSAKNKKIVTLLYISKHGPVPDGLVLRHSCDTPMCINEDHVSPGTQKQNMQDKMERGRGRGMFFPGDPRKRGRLLDYDQILALMNTGKGYKAIAKLIGRSPDSVQSACRTLRSQGKPTLRSRG